VNELVIRAVAVLLWSSAVRPSPAAKAVKRLFSPFASSPAEIGPERAQNPAVDHVEAPQQQRHAAHQVEKNHASHDRSADSNSGRNFRLSAIDGGSMLYFRRAAVKNAASGPQGIVPWRG
jgi:hypothetical protein